MAARGTAAERERGALSGIRGVGLQLLFQMAGWMGVSVVLLAVFLASFFASFGVASSGVWAVVVWVVVNLPLLTLAVIILRSGRIRLSNGAVLEERAERIAAVIRAASEGELGGATD